MADHDESHGAQLALRIVDVPIDEHCIGGRWTTEDIDQLAKLIGIIAMGQAKHAAQIVKKLSPAAPAFTNADLCKEAIIKLTVREGKHTPRTGYPRWQRDGFIFEAISWIAARQSNGETAYLKDPHLSSTTQGLDGLMIEIVPEENQIARTTLFEDKCSDNPRSTFTDVVIPALLEHHKNNRSAELVASAADLMMQSGIDNEAAIMAAQRVFDKKLRRYRASLAVTKQFDSDDQRKKLFKGYEKLTEIEASQRVGASFIVEGELRDWFDILANRSIAFIKSLEVGVE